MTIADQPLFRAAQVLHAFSHMQPGQTLAATATGAAGTARLTYGDLRALVDELTVAHDRLTRIASWHSRETADGGMVGDYCNECGARWPCDTRRMAEGTYVDPDEQATTADPHEPRAGILTWDPRQGPDLDQLAALIRELSGGRCHLHDLDLADSDVHVILATTPLDQAQGEALLRRWEDAGQPDGTWPLAEPSTPARRSRLSLDGCGREHTYRDGCEHAEPGATT